MVFQQRRQGASTERSLTSLTSLLKRSREATSSSNCAWETAAFCSACTLSWPTGMGNVSGIMKLCDPNIGNMLPAFIEFCWFCNIFWPRAVPDGPMRRPKAWGAFAQIGRSHHERIDRGGRRLERVAHDAVGDGKAVAVEADHVSRPQRRQRRGCLIIETAIHLFAVHVKLSRLAGPLDFADFEFDRVSHHADQDAGELAGRVSERVGGMPAYAFGQARDRQRGQGTRGGGGVDLGKEAHSPLLIGRPACGEYLPDRRHGARVAYLRQSGLSLVALRLPGQPAVPFLEERTPVRIGLALQISLVTLGNGK